MRSAQPVKGRAETHAAKDQVISRLLKAWKKNPKLRLGQLIVCANGEDPFYVEDEPFIEKIEEWTRDRRPGK